MVVIFVTIADMKKQCRHFGFLRKPLSVIIHTHRRYCINTRWMTDGERSREVEVRWHHRADWTVSGAAPWGASQSTKEGGCAGLCSCGTCFYIGPPDGLIQGQGYGLSPSHPDPVSIGVLAHPTQTDPSQQREGHAARNLHHYAEVTDQLA